MNFYKQTHTVNLQETLARQSEKPELFRKEQMFWGEPEWRKDTKLKYCSESNFQF